MKLIQRVKIAHLFLHMMSLLFNSIIFSLSIVPQLNKYLKFISFRGGGGGGGLFCVEYIL